MGKLVSEQPRTACAAAISLCAWAPGVHLAAALTEPTPDHFTEAGKVKPGGALLSIWAIATAQECKRNQSTNVVCFVDVKIQLQNTNLAS